MRDRGTAAKGSHRQVSSKHREAGLKAAETKGPEELHRAAKMAAWTRKFGRDPGNPYSRENYPGSQPPKRGGKGD
jgi:hypothetical protein